MSVFFWIGAAINAFGTLVYMGSVASVKAKPEVVIPAMLTNIGITALLVIGAVKL